MCKTLVEGQIVHISDLESAGKYDDAIDCLNTILEANRDRDHDGWLALLTIARTRGNSVKFTGEGPA